MKFAHNLVGVTLRDRLRSEDLREKLKMKWFDRDVREYQKKWMQHLEKMDNNRVPKIIMNYGPIGLRDLDSQGDAGKISSVFRNGRYS
jgi:hypothetical protein